ncbi:MAG TPA: hypothetical protein VKE49_07450 [Myxococcaceae bacterium]|nr:hypothetical protein [Myxococcaceae bacterium]
MKRSNPRRLLLCALFLGACGGGSVGPNGHDVGALCSTDQDCSSRCTHNGDFGTGMCTKPCASDRDCPSGSVCISSDNGMCAVACQNDNECSGFGRAFICGSKSRISGGTSLVCRVP